MPDEKLKPEAPVALPRIEGYRIEALLGKGATGVVYSAVQLAVDRPVALKILHPELKSNKRAVRRLQREARTAARLAHPAIISSIDMGEAQGRWWYAMELVEGISLAERIEEKGVLSEREALRLFPPLVDALQHASEQGVVHRDVKPANILIDERGRARLVDLGLAFAEDDPRLTKSGGTLGTPHYISPEQARDPSDADSRSDIWSLGATLYHALCGRPPFNGASVAEILSAVLYNPVPDPRQFAPGMSKGMALVLRKCLSRDPAKRYQEPAALTRDLERLRERRNPEVNRRTLEPVASDRPEWLRASLWTAALVVVAVGAAAVWSRPWGPAEEAAAPPLATHFAPFERLVARFDLGGAGERPSLRLALTQLDGWLAEGVVPVELREQAEAFRLRVLDELSVALEGVREQVQGEFEQHLATGGLQGLRRLLRDELSPKLAAATGFTELAELPAELDATGRLLLWREALERRLEEERLATSSAAHDALGKYVETVVVPSARERLAERAFVSALALLDAEPATWLTQAGIDERLLLPEDLALLLGNERIEGELHSRRWDVHNAWTSLDDELRAFVIEREKHILADMQEASGIGVDAAQSLQISWEGKLASIGLVEAEVPQQQYEWSSRAEFEAARRRLADAQRRAQGASARSALEADRERADALCRARRYADALAHWDAQLELKWRASVEPDMLRERLIAARLDALLARAVAGVRACAGEQHRFRVDGLDLEGRVTSVSNPLDGFTLVTPGGQRTLHLVAPQPGARGVLDTSALEALAGLGDVAQLGPVERLDLALMRYYEGDFLGAGKVLPVDELPGDEGVVQLELTVRITDTRLKVSAEAKERREELDLLVGRFYRDYIDTGATKKGLLLQIGAILDGYDDILDAEQRADLIARREALLAEPRPLTLEEAFPGAEIERRPRGAVVVRWDFAGGAGAWTAGDWRVTGGALGLARVVETQERYFDQRSAPHVRLAPLLTVEEDCRVSFTFEYTAEDVPLNELVFSVAGFHVVLIDRPSEPRWVGGAKDPEELLDGLRLQEDSSFKGFKGLSRTLTNTVEVSLRPKSRKVYWVKVNGSELTMPTNYVWSEFEPTVRVRSFEPMRLLDVTFEGKLARR